MILAAGGSTRMGKPKALIPIAGVPLLTRHIHAWRSLGADVWVVLGANAEEIGTAAHGAHVVINPDWKTTDPITSLRILIEAAGPGPAWVTPVDTPPTTASIVRGAPSSGSAVPVGPNGVEGHPVRISNRVAAQVLVADGLQGLHTLLCEAQRYRVPTNVSGNFNTPSDLIDWLKKE
jgi:molybdenum cofactor cytidylyltransferase